MGSDPKLERCPVCAKAIYPVWTHAKNDAKAMNRQKRHQGHKAPYRGKCGNIHIGEQSMPRSGTAFRKSFAGNWRRRCRLMPYSSHCTGRWRPTANMI